MGMDINNIIIVSGDNGILMTAKRLSIPFYKIADSLRLSDKLSEEEKELQKVNIDLCTCGSFSIDWVIIDKKLPNPTKDKLNIVIE